jgi:hypothetical protein
MIVCLHRPNRFVLRRSAVVDFDKTNTGAVVQLGKQRGVKAWGSVAAMPDSAAFAGAISDDSLEVA